MRILTSILFVKNLKKNISNSSLISCLLFICFFASYSIAPANGAGAQNLGDAGACAAAPSTLLAPTARGEKRSSVEHALEAMEKEQRTGEDVSSPAKKANSAAPISPEALIAAGSAAGHTVRSLATCSASPLLGISNSGAAASLSSERGDAVAAGSYPAGEGLGLYIPSLSPVRDLAPAHDFAEESGMDSMADHARPGLEKKQNPVDEYAKARALMVAVLSCLPPSLARPPRYTDERVLQAMGVVPRHLFCGAAEPYALGMAWPIECRQTISRPDSVYLSLEAAKIEPSDVVLEIGTGSGYAAAVLSQVAAKVCTIECFQTLHESAKKRLEGLGYDNVTCYWGDGNLGWPEAGMKFDAIILSASPPHTIDTLLDQLAIGGRLVAPMGNAATGQILTRYTKSLSASDSGELRIVYNVTKYAKVNRFVPMQNGQFKK